MGRTQRARLSFRFVLGLLLGSVALTAAAPSARADVLYDQFNNDSHSAIVSDDINDTHLADDFVIPAGPSRAITGVDVPTNGSGMGEPASFNVSFYANGAGNLPGALLASRPASPFTTSSGTDSITISPGVVVAPGTDWVSVQGNSTSGGQPYVWDMRSVQSNAGAAFENPNGSVFPACASWHRKSDCFSNPPPDQVFRLTGATATQTLTVVRSGTGSGSVTSSPAGISCGVLCSSQFAYGSTVALAASPGNGSRFAGWSGSGCSGTGPCQVTMNSDQTVAAAFSANRPDTSIKKAKISQKKHKATFKFKAVGIASKFQCELKRDHQKAKFRPCTSPKTYKHLKPGAYKFKVRALGPGGKDRSPAREKFTIKG